MSKVISLNDPSENKIFQTIGNKRLFQRVVDQIRIAVFKGELRPGNKLPSEDNLVSMLGVSRSAVREAIKVLESAGMLVVQRGYGGGTFVRASDITSIALAYADLLRLSIVDVSELTRARVLLESVAIREAAKRISERDLEILRQNINDAKRYYHQGKMDERLTANLKFHADLARLSGNVILELNVTAILSLLSYYLKTIEVTSGMVKGTHNIHLEIVDLLEKGMEDEVVIVNQEHIEEISKRLMACAAAKEDMKFRRTVDDPGDRPTARSPHLKGKKKQTDESDL